MKSFLLYRKKIPTLKWSNVPMGTWFNLDSGTPENYNLAIVPSGKYIVLDVDRHPGGLDGFKSINESLLNELEKSFNYDTPSNGKHYWLSYTGNKKLMNKASGLGCDLRCDNKGYCVFWKSRTKDIRSYIHLVKETSPELNEWLEDLFCQGKIKKL